jgi:hypothetical protein
VLNVSGFPLLGSRDKTAWALSLQNDFVRRYRGWVRGTSGQSHSVATTGECVTTVVTRYYAYVSSAEKHSAIVGNVDCRFGCDLDLIAGILERDFRGTVRIECSKCIWIDRFIERWKFVKLTPFQFEYFVDDRLDD